MIVRRRRLWDDSINKILLFEEESLKRLNVRFVGEKGAYYGGPTREFAILLEGAPILSGVENSHVFLRDAMRLDRREYEAYGRLVALALLHKCAGPHNLSRSLVDYILDPENVVYNPNDIPDFEVRRLVLQLMECNTTASMDMLSQELDDIRIDAGYKNAIITIQDRDMMGKKICKHNIITKQLEEIQQFTTGLNICGVLSALKKHKEEARKELTYHSCLLTADKI